jgi:hypothetical protein
VNNWAANGALSSPAGTHLVELATRLGRARSPDEAVAFALGEAG